MAQQTEIVDPMSGRGLHIDNEFAARVRAAGADYEHIAGAGTTTITAQKGVLERIVINKAIAQSTITIHDGETAAGPIIAVIAQPLNLLQAQVELIYNIAFTALTIVTTAADDITVGYRHDDRS